MSAEARTLLLNARQGDRQALAKLLSWLERSGPKASFALDDILQPSTLAFRFGITGPPGAGKSTLVAGLIGELRKRNFTLGVLAVDPSSPFSRGAVLGDRIRYKDHFLDEKVFIRSLGTRGSLGGLSASAYLMLRAFDAVGFDFVLVETVGVGQTELDILHVADQVGVVLVPESGDSIQAMKAGLMEIADIFIVNKADRPGADSMAKEIEASIHDGESSKSPRVIKAIATEKQGVNELTEWILEKKKSLDLKSARGDARRLQEEARALLRAEWESQASAQTSSIRSSADLQKLFS